MTRSVFQRYARNENGEAIPNAEVNVVISSGPVADIFTDEVGGVAVTQPMIADVNGYLKFYVDPGLYDVMVTDPLLFSSSTFEREEIGASRESLIDDDQHAPPYSPLNPPPIDLTLINDLSQAYEVPALSDAINGTVDFPVGKVIDVAERTTGNGGGAKWDVYPLGTFAVGPLVFDVYDHATLPFQLKLRTKSGVFNVSEFGAVGDGVNDDYLPIQAAYVAAVEYARNIARGATILYPPFLYYITGTICPLPTGENTLDRYNDGQAGTLTTSIGKITVRGFGARLICDTATFVPSFPFTMTTCIEADSFNMDGLEFESDLNNKVANWMDDANYFNKTVPAVSGEFAFIGLRLTNSHITKCVAEHCEGGFVIADDRTFNITTPDPMLTYNNSITGCRLFNVWAGLSMTYGACEGLLIKDNFFTYTFIKLVQESDKGRAVQFKDNICRDIAGILINTNNTQITGNQFNNLLGGISLQPQGGSNPTTDYGYDLIDFIIEKNQCYSDHATEVNGELIGSGTAKPQAAVIINASSAFTAGQSVDVKGLKILNNNFDLWPVGGSSTGSFLNRAGDANVFFSDLKARGNTVTLHTANGAFVALASNASSSFTFAAGKVDISENKFKRTAANANFEFQMWLGSNTSDSELVFDNNEIDCLATNRLVTFGNWNKFQGLDNKVICGAAGSSTASIFWAASTPKVNIQGNDIIRLNDITNTGYILLMDGYTTSVYDTVLDKAVVQVKGNTITSAQFAFSSLVTFPVSSGGQYDILDNAIKSATVAGVYSSGLPGFVANNVVNPSAQTPPVKSGVPVHKTVQSFSTVSGFPHSWRFDGTWVVLGLIP